MNRILAPLALILCTVAPAETTEKKIDASPGQTLEVNLATGGSILLRGGPENAVIVKSTPKGRDAASIRLNVERTKGGVSVTSKYEDSSSKHSGSLNLEITVPVRFDVHLKSMGGSIQMEGIEGDLQGSTMGGTLELSRLKGKVHLYTMGGGISLTSSEVDGKVSTMGGKVKIKDVKGDVKGSSMGGDVVYENVQRPGGKDSDGKEVDISTMGGAIHVPSAPAGARVKTMGGKITIGSAREFVKATTMGGDIEIKELDGGVAATTMGGSIDVTMVGDPASGKRDVRLDSKGGELRLVLPAGLSMDIDVELEYTKSSSKNYKIQSDFPLSIQESPEWTESKGSPRKTIKGTASIGGGKNKIVLHTVNGNVTIVKR